MAIGIAVIYRTKNGDFYSFYVFFHEFFADLVTFWRISAKINELLPFILCCLRPCLCLYCCCGSPFCCWHCDVPIVSAAVASSMLFLASLFLQGSLLLIASILCWRSCCCFHSCCCLGSCCCKQSWYCVLYVPDGFRCWSLCYCWRSWCNHLCCWCFCCSSRTCCCWQSCCYVLHYRTTVSDYDYWTVIFSAIELSEYRILYWRIQGTIGYRIKASIYRTIGYRTQKKLSVAHLWK